ncbi:serine/threonine kinase-like domain-containing protein STKLD1 isoform X3 [Lineus longissimus]|uniref:serine/threonine kinase-like domain-containing protein STKLD1 isoform X3 n=1 Tax=Lineus longissimus TaxID=88925 RepID=UPI00315D8961
MENYRVLQRLGKGAQGTVNLVESKIDNKKYVMKKVECTDESEANKAFKEAMALAELRHPYVCGYQEFFVTWDKEESAMFVCIVMDYYKLGDLDKALKQKRLNKSAVDEIMVKKWLGQMIEALVFVHKKGIIHRDLKPSNIFMADNLNIAIGDFGVATIMDDARTKTRTTVGSMNWMAPEVLERPYDERSDVWSAGCIALEMITCGVLDSKSMSQCLYVLKNDQVMLEDLISKTTGTYSNDLLALIRCMLRRKFQQRPTAVELLDMPYVKECLTLSDSALVERKKKQATQPKTGTVPKEQGVTPVLAYIRSECESENALKDAMAYLAELTKEEDTVVDDAGKKLVAQTMRENIACVEIQVAGCNILNNLIVSELDTATETDVLFSSDVVSVIPLAMKCHSGSSQLQQAAAAALMAFSANESAAAVIGQVGGIGSILDAMRTFKDKEELQATCCNAIWSLCVNEDNSKMVTDERGLRDVCETMGRFSQNPDVVEAAAAAILSLSLEDDNLEFIGELECVRLLLEAISTHPKDRKVVKNSCMALASLVEPDEESAFKVLDCERKDGTRIQGIPKIVEAYGYQSNNAEVVENVCTLFMELVEYDDVMEEMRVYKQMFDMLKDIQKKYKDNEDVIASCESALTKLDGGKASNRPVSARNRPKSARR